MKKILATTIVTILLVCATLGCTGGGQPTAQQSPPPAAQESTAPAAPEAPAEAEADDVWQGDPVNLTMMVFPATENYEKINAQFLKQNPDIDKKVDITVELGGSGDQDVAQKMRLQLASGQPLPDLIRLNYTQLPEFGEADVLEDISSYIAPYENDIIDAAKQAMQYKGKYLAFPREIKPKVWFYRADIFEECGIDPREVKTIDDYNAAGEKIQEKYPDAHMENFNIPTQGYDLMMMLSGTDGRFCDESGKYNISSNADVKLTFERIKKIHDSKVNSPVVEWSADWAPAFNDGTIVSQLLGGWFKTDFMNFKLEDMRGKWAIAPWPEEIRSGSDAGGAIWVIPQSSPNKDVAAAFISKLCFDNEASKIIYDITGIIPALESAKADPYFNADHDYYKGSLGPVNFEAMGYLKIYPYTPASTQEIAIVKQYLDEYLSGTMTVEAALEAAEKDMLTQIGNPYEQ